MRGRFRGHMPPRTLASLESVKAAHEDDDGAIRVSGVVLLPRRVKHQPPPPPRPPPPRPPPRRWREKRPREEVKEQPQEEVKAEFDDCVDGALADFSIPCVPLKVAETKEHHNAGPLVLHHARQGQWGSQPPSPLPPPPPPPRSQRRRHAGQHGSQNGVPLLFVHHAAAPDFLGGADAEPLAVLPCVVPGTAGVEAPAASELALPLRCGFASPQRSCRSARTRQHLGEKHARASSSSESETSNIPHSPTLMVCQDYLKGECQTERCVMRHPPQPRYFKTSTFQTSSQSSWQHHSQDPLEND